MTEGPCRRLASVAGILDQGLSAASGFVATLALARWLPPRDFGAYAVGLSALAWMLTAHSALVSEPALVYGASAYDARPRAYAGGLARLHLMVSAALMLALSLGALLIVSGPYREARPILIANALTIGAVALPVLARRLLYVAGRPDVATCVSLLQFACSLPLLLALQFGGGLSSVAAVAALAAGALTAGLAGYGAIWHLRRDGRGPARLPLRDLWQQHLAMGRWSMVAALLTWANANLPLLVLPLHAGIEAPGTLRAAGTLMAPVLQVNAALGVLWLPTLTRQRGTPAWAATVRQAVVAVSAIALLGWLLLALGGAHLSRLAFRERIDGLIPVLPVMALLPLTEGIGYVLGSALRSVEATARVARAQMITCLAVTVPTSLFVAGNSAFAAGTCLVLASAVSTILLGLQLRRLVPLPSTLLRHG